MPYCTRCQVYLERTYRCENCKKIKPYSHQFTAHERRKVKNPRFGSVATGVFLDDVDSYKKNYSLNGSMSYSRAAARLGIGMRYLSQLISEQKLKRIFYGGHSQVTEKSFQEYLIKRPRKFARATWGKTDLP